MKDKTRYFVPTTRLFVKYWVCKDGKDFFVQFHSKLEKLDPSQHHDSWDSLVEEGIVREVKKAEIALIL